MIGGPVWREGYVPGGDTRFFARAMGHGDDLMVMLHGWPEDGTMWRRVAPLLVDEGWRVVCPDLKGYGRTEGSGGYDPRTLADEIASLIRNLHVRRAVLVGHDWGGAVALATAFRHPGRVSRLVLVSSPYRQIDLRSAWHIPVLNLPLLPELGMRTIGRRLVEAALRYGSGTPEAFPSDVVDQYTAAISANPSGWLSYYRTLSRKAVVSWGVRRAQRAVPLLPNPEERHPLRVPALVVWGEEDRVLPVRLAHQAATDLEADLITLPDVGHFVPEEDPLALARALLAFVRSDPSASAAAAS